MEDENQKKREETREWIRENYELFEGTAANLGGDQTVTVVFTRRSVITIDKIAEMMEEFVKSRLGKDETMLKSAIETARKGGTHQVISPRGCLVVMSEETYAKKKEQWLKKGEEYGYKG